MVILPLPIPEREGTGGIVPLNPEQQRTLRSWMRSKAVALCPTCGHNDWRFAQAAYVTALLEEGDTNLTEDKGVVKIPCGNCGYVLLFDAETIGIRALWDGRRNL